MNRQKTSTFLALAATSFALLHPATAHATETNAAHKRGDLLLESFRGGATVPGVWRMVSPMGAHTPCLTAATAPPPGSLGRCNAGASDKVGQGAYQLTDNSAQDAGDLMLDKPIPTRAGLHISFDAFQFNATTKKGADGIAFFLVDGTQSGITPGNAGGSLGYKGLKGALVGIGLDEFGNFSNPKIFGSGPGERPNSVVVRGAASTGYKYVQGATAPGALAVDQAKKRDNARRTVSVDMSTRNVLNVAIDFHDGSGPIKVVDNLDLDGIPGQPKLPPVIKLGFSASTGSSTNYHELRDFAATTLDPSLSIKASGTRVVKANGTGTVTLKVANAAAAGPTSGTVTATYTMPAQYKGQQAFTISSATGPGWTCKVAAPKVTCTRPDLLLPGTAYPPITVAYRAGTVPFQGVPTVALVDTPGQSGTADRTDAFPITIELPSGPNLSSTITHQGTATPGGVLTYQLKVSNNVKAAPTHAIVGAYFTAPPGATITGVDPGTGWTCGQSGQTVSCSRPGTGNDALQPGASYPPIKVRVRLPAYSGGTSVTVTGGVNTDGDTDPEDNAAVPDTVGVPDMPPALTASISHDGVPAPGDPIVIHMNVVNSAQAGPTSDTVTATMTLPAGLTAKSFKGDGWQCKAAGSTVSCVRPGLGSDALVPGSFYPEITVRAVVDRKAAGKLQVTGTVKTGGVPGTVTPDTVTIAEPPGPARTGLAVTVTSDPQEFVAGQPFSYQVTITNDGPNTARGAELAIDLPPVWQRIPWKCEASAGSACPLPQLVNGVPQPITGSLDTTVDVAPGGKIVLTVSCLLSARQLGEMNVAVGLTPPPGAQDSKCTDGCAATVKTLEALRLGRMPRKPE